MPITLRGVTQYHLGSYTVANLPTTSTLSTLEAGDTAYATDGRKASEGSGAGTGTLVFFDGEDWIRPDTGGLAVA